MSDPTNPQQPAPADGITPAPPAPASSGVAPAPAGPTAAAPPPPPPTTVMGFLLPRVANLLLIVTLWAVAAAVLWVYRFEAADAIGYGALLAFLGGFLLRPPLMQALTRKFPKTLPPPPPHPPATPAEQAREVVETVVFVVVLVLLLKSFVAEAFVIPTGSMATTLLGYNKRVTCPQCGHKFPVNCSNEVEGSGGDRFRIGGCACPNCRQRIRLIPPGEPLRETEGGVISITDPGWRSGDRVLVAKYPYDFPAMGPHRLDVVVFKFPGDDSSGPPFPESGPFKQHVPMNYIKRLIGLPGETVFIHRGKVYILAADAAPAYADDEKARRDPDLARIMWRTKHRGGGSRIDWMHSGDTEAKDLFKKAVIVRKPPAILLDMMRIVYDNDQPARDLTGEEHRRWVPAADSGWAEDAKARSFRHGGGNDEMTWLRYRHVLRDEPAGPQLITDFLGYNTWSTDHDRVGERGLGTNGRNWASDLIAECEATNEKADGQLALEVSRGPSRFRATFDSATGQCSLYRIRGDKTEELGTAATAFKGAGTFRVRLANADDRLIVWVNGRLAFGDGVSYQAAERLAPTRENDLNRPVSVGAKGGRFTVRHLKINRDVYYTAAPSSGDIQLDPANPDKWAADFDGLPKASYYVQPGHYLCMGDNSTESADSRSWGLVPQRLMLGRAVLVYFPFTRVGRIR